MSKSDASIHLLRKLVVDVFLLTGLGACIFITDNLWLPFERGFFCGDETLMFPFKEDTVTNFMLKFVGLGVPILAIVICEWAYLRNERDDAQCFGFRLPAWVRGAYCALVSFSLGVCFIELTASVAKNTIGRPRPHFFDLCKPSVDCSAPEWQHRYIQSHEYHCTSQHPLLSKNMRMSFLSGHSAWSAFTMLYFALYLEKRMVWRGSRALRHTLQFCAVMLSWFTALSRVSDYKHHWSDVLAGYVVGMAFAVIVFFWGTDLVQKKKNHSQLPQNDVALTIHTETLS